MESVVQVMKFMFPLLACYLLMSCEGSTDYEFTVRNNSSQDVTVELTSYLTSDSMDVITAGASKTILITSTLGGRQDPGNVSDHLSKMQVFSTADTVNKAFNENDNWGINSKQVSKVPSHYLHTFCFSFSDSDFD